MVDHQSLENAEHLREISNNALHCTRCVCPINLTSTHILFEALLAERILVGRPILVMNETRRLRNLFDTGTTVILARSVVAVAIILIQRVVVAFTTWSTRQARASVTLKRGPGARWRALWMTYTVWRVHLGTIQTPFSHVGLT